MDKRVLFVLMPKGYQDLEFNTPRSMLIGAGCSVDVAGLSQNIAHGALGGTFIPNKILANMSDSELATYDALVIPGGPGSIEFLWNDAVVSKTIMYFHNNKKLVAAICYATVAVAKSGILNGKKATGYPTTELKDIFKQQGVEYVEDGCYSDIEDKIITAQSPKFAEDFGKAILNFLTS